MTRAERRRMEREAHRSAVAFKLRGNETCDRCGRHLDDGPPGVPTLSIGLGPGSTMYACAYCAPDLAAIVGIDLPVGGR